MAVDVSGIAGDVYGVVGMGIGLGVLAGSAGMVMRSMDRNLYGRKDASQRGWKEGGRGRYRTEICRHPQIRRTTTTRRKTTTKKRTRYTPYTTQRDFYNPFTDQPKFDIERRF